MSQNNTFKHNKQSRHRNADSAKDTHKHKHKHKTQHTQKTHNIHIHTSRRTKRNNCHQHQHTHYKSSNNVAPFVGGLIVEEAEMSDDLSQLQPKPTLSFTMNAAASVSSSLTV